MPQYKTVFLSYRYPQQNLAIALCQALEQQGFDVFYDPKNVYTDSWKEVVTSQIHIRAHFVLLLTPTALEYSSHIGDMMRHEITVAIEQKRNIIPLLIDGFTYKKAEHHLTYNLVSLPQYRSIEFFPENKQSLQEIMERLKEPISIIPEHESSDSYFYRGYAKLYFQNYLACISDFDEVLRLQPDNIGAYYNRGIAKYHLKDYQGVIVDTTEIIRLNPSYPDVYMNRGIANEELGNYQEAIENYNQVIRLNPNDFQAYDNRGYVKYCLENYQDALEDFDFSLRISPSANAYNNRGITKIRLGNNAEAVADFQKAIQLQPNFEKPYLNLAEIYNVSGEYQKALDVFTPLLTIGVISSEIYYSLGLLKYRLKNYPEAIVDYDKAIELDPISVHLYYGRGLVKSAMQDYQGAVDDYDQALGLQGDFPLLISRAYAKFKMKDYLGAMKDYEEILRQKPDESEAYSGIGSVKYNLGDYQGALLADNEGIRLQATPPSSAYNNRGEVYFALGEYNLALEDFREALKLKHDSRFAHAGIAITHHALGHVEEALDVWDYLLAIDHQHNDVQWVGNFYNWQPPLIAEVEKLIAKL